MMNFKYTCIAKFSNGMAEEIVRKELEKRVSGLSSDEMERLITLVNNLVEVSTAFIPDKRGRCKKLVLDFVEGSSGELRGHSG